MKAKFEATSKAEELMEVNNQDGYFPVLIISLLLMLMIDFVFGFV